MPLGCGPLGGGSLGDGQKCLCAKFRLKIRSLVHVPDVREYFFDITILKYELKAFQRRVAR